MLWQIAKESQWLLPRDRVAMVICGRYVYLSSSHHECVGWWRD